MKTYSVGSILVIVIVLAIFFMIGNAEALEKNNGIVPNRTINESGEIQSTLLMDHPWPVNSIVKALVDSPSSSVCVNTGDLGTIYGYDPNDPTFPYLVNWNSGCGHSQCWKGNCAPNGWWVGFNEIELVVDPSSCGKKGFFVIPTRIQ